MMDMIIITIILIRNIPMQNIRWDRKVYVNHDPGCLTFLFQLVFIPSLWCLGN